MSEGDEEGVGDEGDAEDGEGDVDAEDREVEIMIQDGRAGEFGGADVDDSVEVQDEEGPEEAGGKLH